MRGPRGLTSLRHHGFRYLLGGQLASNLGDGFYAVALPWYVLSHHGGALLLAVVLAAYGVPRTLLIIVGGQAADRFGPWTVMLGADAVRAVAAGALAVVVASGPAHAATLVPVAVVLGAGEGLFLPGSMSIIPALLPGAELQAGNALAEAGTQLAALAGPALGGIVVAAAGPAPAFIVDAVTFAVSAVTLAGVRAGMTRQAAADAVAAGPPAQDAEPAAPPPTLLQILRRERVLQIIILITAAANLGSGGMGEVALPALAHGPFHAGASGYGFLVAALAVGGLLGTLVAGQAPALRRPVIAASVAFAVEGVFVALVPYLGGSITGGIALAIFGGLNGFGNILAITTLQKWTEPAVLGRVMSVVILAAFGLFPVSVLFGGAVVHAFGPAAFFPITGGILLVAVSVGLTQRDWREFGATARTPGLAPSEG